MWPPPEEDTRDCGRGPEGPVSMLLELIDAIGELIPRIDCVGVGAVDRELAAAQGLLRDHRQDKRQHHARGGIANEPITLRLEGHRAAHAHVSTALLVEGSLMQRQPHVVRGLGTEAGERDLDAADVVGQIEHAECRHLAGHLDAALGKAQSLRRRARR